MIHFKVVYILNKWNRITDTLCGHYSNVAALKVVMTACRLIMIHHLVRNILY